MILKNVQNTQYFLFPFWIGSKSKIRKTKYKYCLFLTLKYCTSWYHPINKPSIPVMLTYSLFYCRLHPCFKQLNTRNNINSLKNKIYYCTIVHLKLLTQLEMDRSYLKLIREAGIATNYI